MSSIFSGLSGGGSPQRSSSNKPTYSFVRSSHSNNTHRASSSHYKRRPRDGYIARLYDRIRYYLRKLWSYVRKHPVKVLLPIVMALISGGVLHNVARSMGITLPGFLRGEGRGDLGSAMQGMSKGFGVEDAFYGSQRAMSGGGGGWLGDSAGVMKGAVKMASAFL